jgi:glycosyltransferase involved in cell wall biosynthesis
MVLLAHPGTQYALRLARELERHAMLTSFHTCLAVSANSNLARVAQRLAGVLGMKRQFQNRLLEGVSPGKLHCYPTLEIGTLWRMRNSNGAGREILRQRNDRFQQKIPDRAIESADTIVGFDTSSRILAGRAKALGKKFILDRSIGHPRSFAGLSEQLNEHFPGWEDVRNSKSQSELASEEEEHELADLIVVPSRFVAETLREQGVAREKIRINPFGTDTEKFYPAGKVRVKGPLVFLFVGALGARKGLPLLLRAWQQIKSRNAQLWIAGAGYVPAEARSDSPDSVRWLGAVSRSELPDLFRSAHVFVFPSFFEGLAQAQIEAAASGLPIIATVSSGGEEIVAEGQTGFIIETGNLDQLVERLERFIDDPDLLAAMSERARLKAGQWSWAAYGDRWRDILQEKI